MKNVLAHIKNYIQLHTSDIENDEYVGLMRKIARWADKEADRIEASEDNPDELDIVFPIID